jgi:hypothetical protein
MSDDIEEQEAPEVDTGIDVPGEERPEEAAVVETPADDVEAKARSQGWVPKDQFRGDPEKWRPADEFVKRGEELLPIALERARSAERRVQDMEAQFQQQLKRVEKVSQIALERQRADLQARYDAALRDAAASGDLDRYDNLSQGRQQAFQQFDEHVQKQLEEEAAPRRDQGLPPELRQTVEGWIAENNWFNVDQELNAVAQAHHMRLLREQPGLPLTENLAQTRKYVQQRYPERFGITQKPPVQAAVEPGGGRMPSASAARAKGANDLPADVRAVGERFVKQGLFKDLGEYARDYFADN